MRCLKTISILILILAGINVARAEWVKQNTNSFAWYRDIFFLNESRGWIVGSDGVILNTYDGGLSWIQDKKFTNDDFTQVYFENQYTGWLLCQRNVFNRGKEPASYLRKTVNGGHTWEKVEFEFAGRERVTKLLFGKDGSARAFGEGGVFYMLQEDGITWKKQETAIHYLLLDGDFSDDTVGAIVGAGGTILFTEDSGFTWEKATLIGETDVKFNAIYFYGHRGAWAVGSRGRIFRSNGGGRLWRQQQSTVTANLNSVYFTSVGSGWAVGDHGIIVGTRDGGNSWQDYKSGATHKLEKVLFSGGRGWAVGFGVTILTYSEGSIRTDPGEKPILLRRN